MGFHSIPSIEQLHLHVISQDFDSPALKHPKHWRSFATEFFRPVDVVLEELKSQGRSMMSKERAEQLLRSPLKCHRCHAVQTNLPALKRHISACTAALP